MKKLVVYTSKYGSTAQYARWISEDVHADLCPTLECNVERLHEYDTVIFGGYLHMGKIVGIDFIINNWEHLDSKKVIVFTVSGAGPSPTADVYFENNVPEHMRPWITHFAFRGRAQNLDWKDRTLIAVPRTLLYVKYLFNPTEETKKAYQGFAPFDDVKREHIESLISFVKNA